METILFLAYTEADGKLPKPALEALGAAKELQGAAGGAMTAALIGENVRPAAESIAHCGAQRILGVAGPDFAEARYAADAAAAEALCRAAEATIVVAPGTSRVNRVLAGVGHRLGGAADLHITRVGAENNRVAASRWYYRQRMLASIQRQQRPWLLAIDPGTYAPWQGESAEVNVELARVALPASARTRVQGFQTPDTGTQTIRPEAELLLVAGAGWTKKQADGQAHVDKAAELILDFLGHTKASLGGSKSMVDLTSEGQAVLPFMTHLNQVGQTGSTPRHPKGLATCCHGEEPHVVGWRFVNERRAINLDPNCGWAHGKADVLYVADAFEVLAKVNSLLAEG
jgi:electron transfer flavoprotein alpha subunit